MTFGSISVVGLFCEDIRDEAAGSATLVGVLPGNISISVERGYLPKLCFYGRVMFPTIEVPTSIKFSLQLAGGERIAGAPVDIEQLRHEAAEAAAAGNPLAGSITRMAMVGFPTIPGIVTAFAEISGIERPVAQLRFVLQPAAKSPPSG